MGFGVLLFMISSHLAKDVGLAPDLVDASGIARHEMAC